MKKFKLLYLLIAFVAASFAMSCTETNEYAPGEAGNGTEVYFSNENTTSFNLSDGDNSIDVVVNRIDAKEEQSISILHDVAAESASFFTIPNSVVFAAGEKSAKLTIGVDVASLTDGEDYNIALLINDPENTTQYGLSSLNITVARWPWELMEGKGKLRDDFFSSMFNWNSFAEVDVTVYKHKSQEGIYMIENPWGPVMMGELLGATAKEIIDAGYCADRDINLTIDCSDPDDVFIPLQEVGVNVNDEYGWIMIGTFAGGTLKDGVITFPVGGLAMRFPNYNGGSNFRVNSDGMFRILLPGAEVTDYSLAVEYDGMKVETDGETASAILNFVYGADVTGIEYVVAAGNLSEEDIATVATSIINGTAENVNKIDGFNVGGETVSEEFVLSTSGAYSIVAVALDKAGKPTANGIASTTFFFPGAGGSTAPECELAAGMGLVSEYWEEMSEQLPDSSSLYFEIAGSELKSVIIYIDTTDAINNYKANGYSEEVIVDALGSDFSEKVVPSINANGSYGSAWINRRSDTSYTMIVKATNIYEKSKVVSATYSTAAIPYSGDLAIGNYVMHFDAPANDGSTIPCDNYIKIVPQTEGNNTDFFVFDFGLEIEVNSWYAKYDASASTLTLSGIIQGFESYGNMFGEWIGFSETEAERIMSFNAADENSQGADPVVIKVDPATKQLAAIDNDILVYLGTLNGNSVSNPQLTALYYADGTTFAKESAAAAATPKSLGKKSRSAKVPFSNVQVPADTQMTVAFEKKAFANTATVSKSNMVRTISVNATKCEPLQKTVSRSIKSGAATLDALK